MTHRPLPRRDLDDLTEGDVVVIGAFDDIPEHLFRVLDVYDDLVTGYSISGPLAGEYGEPSIDMIKGVHEA